MSEQTNRQHVHALDNLKSTMSPESAFSLRETLLRDTSRVEYPSLPFLVLADHQFKVFSASAPPSAPASAQNSPIQTRGRRLMSRLAAQVTAQDRARSSSEARCCLAPSSHTKGMCYVDVAPIKELDTPVLSPVIQFNKPDKQNTAARAPLFYSGGFSPF